MTAGRITPAASPITTDPTIPARAIAVRDYTAFHLVVFFRVKLPSFHGADTLKLSSRSATEGIRAEMLGRRMFAFPEAMKTEASRCH